MLVLLANKLVELGTLLQNELRACNVATRNSQSSLLHLIMRSSESESRPDMSAAGRLLVRQACQQ